MGLMGSSQFVGFVTLDAQNPAESTSDPSPATATYALNANATVISTGEAPANWLSIPGNTNLFEARMTVVSGALTNGTINTWLNCGSNLVWELVRGSLGSSACTATIEVRLASTGVVQDSATINFTADVF